MRISYSMDSGSIQMERSIAENSNIISLLEKVIWMEGGGRYYLADTLSGFNWFDRCWYKIGLWTFSNGNELLGNYSQTKVPLKDDEVRMILLFIEICADFNIFFMYGLILWIEKQKNLKYSTRLDYGQWKLSLMYVAFLYISVPSHLAFVPFSMIYLFQIQEGTILLFAFHGSSIPSYFINLEGLIR